MPPGRGSVLPGTEMFDKVLIPNRAFSVSITLGVIGAVTRVEVPDTAKSFSIFASDEIGVALDADPVLASSGATTIAVSDLGVGINLQAATFGVERVFCFDIHGKVPKELRLVSSVNNPVVELSFF